MTDKLDTLPTEQTFSNVTFYVKGGMSITRVDAKTLKIKVKQYAQYERAIFLTWLGKGKRQERGMVISPYHTFFVLVNRADAIDPDSMLDSTTRQVSDNGTVTTRGRYSSCDPRWQTDFAGKIEATGITPLIFIDEPGKVRGYANV
jgi:hypothetical protein